DFVVPSTAKALMFRFSSDTIIDNNKGEGYMYAVYKNNKPIQGASGSMAKIYSGRNQGRIKPNSEKALSLMNDEFEHYPASKNKFAFIYLNLLANSKKDEDKKTLEAALKEFAATDNETALMAAQQYNRM